ncbi:MAG: peptide-methionine (S)-S-oxide reductase MsrA [Alphaproteobacteria bacterium]|nr:peptide-methionine (S)-S-oxide reductase MsrA [Alphaproteobacteria bacterium]
MFFSKKSAVMLPSNLTLPGRSEPIATADTHFVLGTPLKGPYPEGAEMAVFGLGCFWGAERKFWELGDGIITTAVGYAAGNTPNPTYEEVCTGMTNHNEVVLVVFDPAKISYARLLKTFWESHNPTQGMRQGNDMGTQYRSGIYTFSEAQRAEAEASREAYGIALLERGYSAITTEIEPVVLANTRQAGVGRFYFAEDYHQQYLAKVPTGYCGLGGTGVSCPIGTGVASKL